MPGGGEAPGNPAVGNLNFRFPGASFPARDVGREMPRHIQHYIVRQVKLLASHIVSTGGIASPQHDWGVIRMSERGFGPDPVDLQVGKNVTAKRTEVGLSQDHVADRLGLSLSDYQEFESGKRRLSPERLLKLARLLGVSAEDFFEGLPGAASRGFFN
jgi:DNA-binding XRE family transcriptional regulator